jgi:hypothetical protein
MRYRGAGIMPIIAGLIFMLVMASLPFLLFI